MEELVIYAVMGVLYTVYSIYKNREGKKKPQDTATPPIFTEDTRTSEPKKTVKKASKPAPVSRKQQQPKSIEEFLEGYLQEIETGKKNQETQHQSKSAANDLEENRKRQRAKNLQKERENKAQKQQQAYQRKLEAERRRQAELIAAKGAAASSSLEVLDAEAYHEMKHDKRHADYIKDTEIKSTDESGLLEGFEFDIKDAVIYDVIFRRKYE